MEVFKIVIEHKGKYHERYCDVFARPIGEFINGFKVTAFNTNLSFVNQAEILKNNYFPKLINHFLQKTDSQKYTRYKSGINSAIDALLFQENALIKKIAIANQTDIAEFNRLTKKHLELKQTIKVMQEIQGDYKTEFYTGTKALPKTPLLPQQMDFKTQLFAES